MSKWGEENVIHKAAKRTPAPDEHAPTSDRKRKRVEKPYVIYHNWKRAGVTGAIFELGWRRWHKAATREQAEDWVEKQCRQMASWRADAFWKPAGSERTALSEHVELMRQRFKIVGPGESKPTGEQQ